MHWSVAVAIGVVFGGALVATARYAYRAKDRDRGEGD